MTIAATVKSYEPELLRASDGLALATVMSIPWSTTATGILIAAWLLSLLPTLNAADLRRELLTAAGGLPVLLVALAALGMLWSEVGWLDALRGLSPFAKLLIIPLLFIQFRRTDRAISVLGGFLVSCVALLILSLALAIWPKIVPNKSYGVPVKDYIAQSGEFALCAMVSAYVALDLFRSRNRIAFVWLGLAAVFLFDILYVSSSRTALVTLPVMFILLGLRQFGWKGAVAIVAGGILAGALIWASSPYLRNRVLNLSYEVQSYEADKDVTSAGLRLDFWKKSSEFVASAPVLGHGTGSIKYLFERDVTGQTGYSAQVSTNPHNQILGVAIQLGLVGTAVLLAMWLAHLLLFRDAGLIAWVGLLVVVQNVVSSLFNSHLFDFTQGWTYVFGVGVAGGAVLQARRAAPHPARGSATAAKAGQSGIGAQSPL
jgi:O-antigen ligase